MEVKICCLCHFFPAGDGRLAVEWQAVGRLSAAQMYENLIEADDGTILLPLASGDNGHRKLIPNLFRILYHHTRALALRDAARVVFYHAGHVRHEISICREAKQASGYLQSVRCINGNSEMLTADLGKRVTHLKAPHTKE